MSEFKTIAAHIDDLRSQLRQTSDDSIYTDKYLYKKILDARSVLIKRELDKHRLLSDFNYNTICMNVVPGVPVECGCSDLQCKVLVSTIELPKPLQNKYSLFLKVYDGAYNEIPKGDSTKSKFFKYYRTLKNKSSWDIVNNKLVIYNADFRIKSFIVKLVPEDPAELADYVYNNACGCDTVAGADIPCFDVETSNFPLDSWLAIPMYEMVKKQLLGGITNEDLSNNGQSPLNGL
tara:strand:+ start:1437 stop:2138 length:702 start_codon:yes stop_codon:yes gene_type:complete